VVDELSDVRRQLVFWIRRRQTTKVIQRIYIENKYNIGRSIQEIGEYIISLENDDPD
jgi:hypothetical protein